MDKGAAWQRLVHDAYLAVATDSISELDCAAGQAEFWSCNERTAGQCYPIEPLFS